MRSRLKHALGQPACPPASRRSRGFTLLEIMIVVSIVGILAALGAPSMLPAVKNEALNGAGNSVALFVASARMEAMSSRRCVRVRIDHATGPAILVRERINSFDCEDAALNLGTTNTAGAPLIDSNETQLWVETGRLRVEPSELTVAFSNAPGQADSPALSSIGELRYRPTGRLFSSDTTVTNDDGALSITHPRISGANNFISVVADGAGPICITPIGKVLPTGAGVALPCL